MRTARTRVWYGDSTEAYLADVLVGDFCVEQVRDLLGGVVRDEQGLRGEEVSLAQRLVKLRPEEGYTGMSIVCVGPVRIECDVDAVFHGVESELDEPQVFLLTTCYQAIALESEGES